MENNRLVIDTNVFISAGISPGSTASQLIDIAVKHHIIYFSQATQKELIDVLHRGKFDRYFKSRGRENFLQQVFASCVAIEPNEIITDCKDPKDNPFLSVAVSAKAHYLVTGDKKDLLSMNPFRGVEIITARDFLDRENTRKL